MMGFEDFHGGDLIGLADVSKSKNDADLKKIIGEHKKHIEGQFSDAMAHLERFEKRLNIY